MRNYSDYFSHKVTEGILAWIITMIDWKWISVHFSEVTSLNGFCPSFTSLLYDFLLHHLLQNIFESNGFFLEVSIYIQQIAVVITMNSNELNEWCPIMQILWAPEDCCCGKESPPFLIKLDLPLPAKEGPWRLRSSEDKS